MWACEVCLEVVYCDVGTGRNGFVVEICVGPGVGPTCRKLYFQNAHFLGLSISKVYISERGGSGIRNKRFSL
jgi:hypothetical protein